MLLCIGKHFLFGPSDNKILVCISCPNCAISLVILFETGLISQAWSGALTLEEVFALKDVGEGRVGGGRKGAPAPGVGVG